MITREIGVVPDNQGDSQCTQRLDAGRNARGSPLPPFSSPSQAHSLATDEPPWV